MILREMSVEMKLYFSMDNKQYWDTIPVLEGREV